MGMLLKIILLSAQVCIAASVQCRCYSTGYLSVYNNFLAGVPGTGAQYYCNNNRTCTAPSGTGCFRINTAAGDYAFCGMSTFLPYQAGLDYLVTLAPWIVPTITKMSPANCTRQNVDSQGACYCDQADFCNTMFVPKSSHTAKAGLALVAVFAFVVSRF